MASGGGFCQVSARVSLFYVSIHNVLLQVHTFSCLLLRASRLEEGAEPIGLIDEV